MTKTKKKKLLTIGIVAIVLFLFLIWAVGIICTVVVYLLGFLYLLANLKIKKRVAWNADHLFSDIDRNYDYLLIGEPWNYKEIVNGKMICFFSPHRSFLSSRELARRLYSLLKEGTGTLIISCRDKAFASKEISVLDIPYLHEMQLHQYGITKAKMKIYLPLLFAPIASIRYLFAPKRRKFCNVDMKAYPELSEFCKERNIKCQIVKVK